MCLRGRAIVIVYDFVNGRSSVVVPFFDGHLGFRCLVCASSEYLSDFEFVLML